MSDATIASADQAPDCDDGPKLTADEWVYVEAVAPEGDD